MDYESVVAASFQASPPDAVSAPTVQASPARRLRDAIEPIAMHSVWSRATNERLAEMDLDFLTGYVWGRAAALGEPDAGVVVAAFAVFEPGLVRDAYEQGRRACPRDRLLAARTDATVASLLETLEGADVTSVADILERAVSVADGTGRPLFSGLAGQPWPADPVGRLWRACELVREHRGDSHVAACISRGLGPVDMNILTELWVGMHSEATRAPAAGRTTRSGRRPPRWNAPGCWKATGSARPAKRFGTSSRLRPTRCSSRSLKHSGLTSSP